MTTEDLSTTVPATPPQLGETEVNLVADSEFGDDDLASKKRKPSNADEYNTMFTKRLWARGPDANSTMLEPTAPPILVSDRPSDSSFGFHNTFEVLERQMQSNKHAFKLTANQLEAAMTCFKASEGIPLMAVSQFPSIIEEAEEADEDQQPDLFELELEAASRLHELKDLDHSEEAVDCVDHCGAKEEEPNVAKIVDTGEYPEYLYHVAKGQNGKLYLRVVRSMLLDSVLSGNRVSQMTRTYDDIEAVTRLLAEKEKDLELTVQIGKELLTQNNRLENRVAELEAEIKTLRDTLAQLSHELHQKNELVSVLTNDCENDSETSTPNAPKSFSLDVLQRRITSLEDENKSLRTETYQLVQQTDEVEEQERRLMADITNQLNSTASEFDSVCLEMERQKEENRYLHEQNCSLRSLLSEAEIRLHSLTAENEENSSMLSITKETQNSLASELCEFKTRYQEVLALLHEAQEQLRRQRKRSQPLGKSSLLSAMGGSMGQAPADSLQSELMELSLYSDNSLDSGISSERGGCLYAGRGMMGGSQQIPAYKKVFETVRCASNNMSQLGSMAMSSSSQPRMSACIYGGSQIAQPPQQPGADNKTSSVYNTIYKNALGYDGFGGASSLGQRSYSRESLISESEYPGQTGLGVPGAPGAKDLEAALKRLTPAEVLARRAMLQHAPAGTYSYDDAPTGIPLGCRTPDSIMSTGSSGLSGISSNQWRLPEKLQIVKPLEGSQTLHHWSRLAQPNMDGLLEERPGVTIRGGRGLDDLGLHIYSLSDVEEDEEELPGKQFMGSGCIYTYTNSTVMHPDDGTSITFSLPPSQLTSHAPSESTSRQPSCPPTPRASLSRRNSCSTFSVNMGLASMLNERGIKAVTPSAINTPCGPNFTPTSTPCNSPDGSPTRSLSPEPEHMNISGLLASGAELLRRKLIGEVERPIRPSRNKIALSRLERKQLRSIRIMDKVESIGLENIMLGSTANISPLALHGSGALYASGGRGRTNSPMTQLTSLKHMKDRQQQRRDDELYHIDKETIRAVLSKGMSSDSLKSTDARSEVSTDTCYSADSDDSYRKPETSRRSQQRAAIAAAAALTRQAVQESRRGGDSDDTTDATSDVRLRQMQRQRSRRNMKNGGGGQRPDLGQVGRPNVRADLGTVHGGKRNSISNNPTNNSSNNHSSSSSSSPRTAADKPEEGGFSQGFVGAISSMLFGRKGGLL